MRPGHFPAAGRPRFDEGTVSLIYIPGRPRPICEHIFEYKLVKKISKTT